MKSKASNKRLIVYSLYALLLFCSSNVFSQVEDEDVYYQAWFDYNAKYHVSRKFKIYGDVGYRRISPDIWTRYYVRPAVSYLQRLQTKNGKYISITYHLGIGAFFTDFTSISNSVEVRPFQGINVQWPTFKKLRLDHYFRLEERFEYINNKWVFGFRGRYMLSGIYHWNREAWNNLNNFYFPFHTEFFWNITSSGVNNDLVRITPGIGYTFNLKWKMEFSVSYHRTRLTVNDNYETNDIVFRLRVFHNILKK